MSKAEILHIPPGSGQSSASSQGTAWEAGLWAGASAATSAHLAHVALAAGGQPLPAHLLTLTARAHPHRVAQGPL